jgi:hypothetical protein
MFTLDLTASNGLLTSGLFVLMPVWYSENSTHSRASSSVTSSGMDISNLTFSVLISFLCGLFSGQQGHYSAYDTSSLPMVDSDIARSSFMSITFVVGSGTTRQSDRQHEAEG